MTIIKKYYPSSMGNSDLKRIPAVNEDYQVYPSNEFIKSFQYGGTLGAYSDIRLGDCSIRINHHEMIEMAQSVEKLIAVKYPDDQPQRFDYSPAICHVRGSSTVITKLFKDCLTQIWGEEVTAEDGYSWNLGVVKIHLTETKLLKLISELRSTYREIHKLDDRYRYEHLHLDGVGSVKKELFQEYNNHIDSIIDKQLESIPNSHIKKLFSKGSLLGLDDFMNKLVCNTHRGISRSIYIKAASDVMRGLLGCLIYLRDGGEIKLDVNMLRTHFEFDELVKLHSRTDLPETSRNLISAYLNKFRHFSDEAESRELFRSEHLKRHSEAIELYTPIFAKLEFKK